MARTDRFATQGRHYLAKESGGKGEWLIYLDHPSRGQILAGDAQHMGPRRWQWAYRGGPFDKRILGRHEVTSLKRAVEAIDAKRHPHGGWGFDPKIGNPKPTEIQAVLFPVEGWNKKQIRAWLADHDMEALEVEEAEDYYHARIHAPWVYGSDSFRTITLDQDRQIKAVIGKRRNPNDGASHSLPDRTVHLGYALEVTIAEGELIYRATFTRNTMALLAPADAFDRDPGYGRLYVIREIIVGERAARESEAADAYRDWHKGRDPDRVIELDGPDAFDRQIGRAQRIVYASDKFNDRGDFVDYEHAFSEPGPLVYYADEPEGFALVGGSFTVDPRGIVD